MHYEDAKNALIQMITSDQMVAAKLKEIGSRLQSVAVVKDPNFADNKDYIAFMNLKSLQLKHVEWGRKIHSVIMGYGREMQGGFSAAVKDRAIGFAKADLTVGSNEAYAKAVQYKHTVSDDNSSVNKMIAKAANQLTGESGEKPLPGQRKIIDVMINDPNNWWPFDEKDFQDLPTESNLSEGILPLPFLIKRAGEQIYRQLATYKKGSKGLDAGTKNDLLKYDAAKGGLVKSPHGPNTTALKIPGNNANPNVITIKMVYGHPRKFSDKNGIVTVKTLVFFAHLDTATGNLVVTFQQIK